MKVLVVGGAGYIGSHMVKLLTTHNHEAVTLDSLNTGYRDAVLGGKFICGDLADRRFLMEFLRKYQFDAVMHFASFIQVGESMHEPAKYYQNNFVNTLNLLDAIIACETRRFIFSSSAAVFGEPKYLPIDEDHPKHPISPYGKSKLMVEQALQDYDNAYGLKSICLRYFNAAGADPECEIGERHEPETHLIPLGLQVASGRKSFVQVFGRDYDTSDGTCIRDYVHVNDLCLAHLLALESLNVSNDSAVYNLGNSKGYSVQQVLDTISKITGKTIQVREASRRVGDPPELLADSSFARAELGWAPEYSDLSIIVEHAWRWEQKISAMNF